MERMDRVLPMDLLEWVRILGSMHPTKRSDKNLENGYYVNLFLKVFKCSNARTATKRLLNDVSNTWKLLPSY